jgi:hypothetical protein
VPAGTGLLALDPASGRPLFWAAHDGRRVGTVDSVVPGSRELYLAASDARASGLHRLAWPDEFVQVGAHAP